MANETYEQSIARRLSPTQRMCLVEHAAGPQPFLADPHRATKMRLLEDGLLCRSISDSASRTSRPLTLRLTEQFGRKVACAVLADMAEKLIVDGAFHTEENDVVVRVKREQKRPTKWPDQCNEEGGKKRMMGRIACETLLELLHAENSV